MTEFTDLVQGIRSEGDAFVVTVTDDWLQGRTVYGGLGAALCLEAAHRATPDLPPLRSAQFSFIGPATGQLRMQPSTLRRGKSAVYVGCDLSGEAGLATRAILCFGAARASKVAHVAMPAPVVTSPGDYPSFFEFAPPTLAFVQHFDGRLAGGHFPLTRSGEPTMTFWLRHRDPALTPSIVSLLALADAPPPAALVQFPQFAPISTMTWSIDVLTDKIATDDGWWLVRTEAQTIADGYSSQEMTIWNANGVPTLAARQTIAVFI